MRLLNHRKSLFILLNYSCMKKTTLFSNNPKLLFDTVSIILSLLLMLGGSLIQDPAIYVWFWGLAFFIGGLSKAIEGVQKTIEEKSLNVEFLMIAAASAAFFTGEYAEGAILIFIFGVSGVLEEFATAQSERALTNLLKLAPQQAILVKDGVEKVVSIESLSIGDVVRVKVGQQVPADGVLLEGKASFNQASITGEFVPVFKQENDAVFAGAIVVDSTVLVQVNKDPRESVVQKMITFVKEAQEQKTKSEKRVSLFEKIYVYVVIALSLFVIFVVPSIGWLSTQEAFRRGIIVLVVASPCALVASITPGILSTLSHGARHGILVKSGQYLEKVQTINLVAFDKTGTITTGMPHVVEFKHLQRCDEATLLNVLVNAERLSNHPLAKAIVQHFRHVPVQSLSTKEIPGKGMEVELDGHHWKIGRFTLDDDKDLTTSIQAAQTQGQTIVMVIRDEVLVAYVALMDTIRPGIETAITALKQLGVKPVMLTGDNHFTAQKIAESVGIDTFYSECLPQDKVQYIQQFKQQGYRVLMVGDGINDAPSLVTADLGVAMGDGTDVSLETADVVMMNNNLANIPYLMRITRRMKTIILQNVIFSISVIAVLLVSNLFGFVVLTFGVLGHELSTILVILNSLRLLSDRPSDQILFKK